MINNELLKTSVKSVMSTNLKTVGINDNMDKVKAILEENLIHHVPVVSEENELLGIISKPDLELLKHWATNFKLSSAEKQNKDIFNSMLAKDVMNKNVVTISEDTKLEYCADIFKENYFHCLPVIKEGKLKGIITTYDLIFEAYKSAPLNII